MHPTLRPHITLTLTVSPASSTSSTSSPATAYAVIVAVTPPLPPLPSAFVTHYAPSLPLALERASVLAYELTLTPEDAARSPFNIPILVPLNDPAPPAVQCPRFSISLSRASRVYLTAQTRLYAYDGHAAHHGVLAYLTALLAANPDPPLWTDTRPSDLTMFDTFRQAHNRLPLWSAAHAYPGFRRVPTPVPIHHFAALTPALLRMSHYFLITPAHGRITPTSQASAVIEAIGVQYLTPTHPPLSCDRPANPRTRRYRANRKRREAIDVVF